MPSRHTGHQRQEKAFGVEQTRKLSFNLACSLYNVVLKYIKVDLKLLLYVTISLPAMSDIRSQFANQPGRPKRLKLDRIRRRALLYTLIRYEGTFGK